MSQRPIWYADRTAAGRVVVATEAGELWTAPSARDFAELGRAERAIVWTEGAQLQIELAELAVDTGAELEVALGRGDSSTLQLRAVWLDQLAVVDRSMLLPDGGLRAELQEAAAGPMPTPGGEFEAEARVALLQHAHTSWRARIVQLGLQPRMSVGATAAGIVPRSWRKAAQLLQREEPWQWVRKAYYGGRIECYRPGFQGEAIEYDLRAAYGWSLSLPVPDWKLYERKWIPVQDPAWLECTVEVSGAPGPLPVRDELGRLSWPTSGRWRGVWTRADLEQDGVRIIELHRQLAGRWSSDLQRPISAWLELRERTDSPAMRALLRLLCCSMAGKLCQRPVTWKLWRSGEEPPQGAQALAIRRSVWAVPSSPLRWPLTCPQAGSFVTARVRRRVRPALQHPACIYTDTDSAHYPADVDPPLQLGARAGEWSEKARGPSIYRGLRQYRIGRKTVGNVVLKARD